MGDSQGVRDRSIMRARMMIVKGVLATRLRWWREESRRLVPSLLLVTAAGFASKLYRGPADGWFNDHLAGLFYVVFWCLVALALFPEAPPVRLASWVLALTCSLELLQLWDAPLLRTIRGTFVGRSLIGTTFQAWDFLYYALGWGIGWTWTRWLSHEPCERAPGDSESLKGARDSAVPTATASSAIRSQGTGGD